MKKKKLKAEYGFSVPTDVKPPKKKFKLTDDAINEAYDSFEPNLKKMDFGIQQTLQPNDRQPLRDTINPNPMASMVPVGQRKQSPDYSSLMALGLTAIDALIPGPKIKNPVVQPYENYSYNQNPYGTGSQMLMKKGGKVKADLGGLMPLDDDPKRKKKKDLQGTVRKNFGFDGVIDDSGRAIDYPTMEKTIKVMSQFMKNNWGPEAPNPSNNYIPQWQHQSYDPVQLPQIDTARKGGKMKAQNGINIENDNYSQLSPSIFQVEGNSHANGGTDINFMGNTIEAEKGEPITMDNQGNLTIFGNMKNPLTGNKYKKDAQMLARKENKAKKYFDTGLELIDNNDPKGKYSAYAFNAGKVMMMGGKGKLDEINQAKEHLGDLQNAHLQLVGEENKTARNGIKMYANGGKADPPAKWKFNGTDTKGLDQKILDFVKIAEAKGLGGYSGPQSGVSQRNTKSGRLSRHAQKQALDMIFSSPDAYQKILSDPDLSGYLVNNGLTAINEYDPKTANKTGATTGHIHIGYDKGTAISDKFRQDAKQKWGNDNPTWNWSNRVGSKGKPIVGAPSGDFYDVPGIPSTKLPYDDKTGKHYIVPPELISGNQNTPPVKPQSPTQLNDYQFNFSDKKRTPYSNAKPLDLTNVLGEAYGVATNQQEPVFMQQYQPDLYSPYKVSFQDRINQNNRTFNASQQLAGYNPEALSTLSGELYNANSQVSADEFRTNQGIANDITNKNISLLNEAKGKNLQLADTQYIRQSQAKSNTKAVNQEALNSISSKVLQNKKENNALRVYENLYPDFRFDKNYQKDYVGAPAADVIDWQGIGGNTQQGASRQTYTYNPDGTLKQSRVSSSTKSPTEQELEAERLKQLKEKGIPKLKDGGKVNLRKWLSSI